MERLKIAATGQVVQFLNRYEIWHDSQVFYKNKTTNKTVFIDETGIPCFSYQDLRAINSCDSPLIAIDNLVESIHSKHMFLRYSKNKHYLIFTCGTWNRDLLPVDYTYDIIHNEEFLIEMGDSYNTPNRFPYYIEKRYKFEYPKKYNWCSIIGQPRPVRTKLVNELQKISKGQNILKYHGQDLEVKNHNLDVVNISPGEFAGYTPLLEKYYHNVSQTLPINLYNSCNFSVTVETDLDLPGSIFLTEKTLKSLITGIPFVLASNVGMLKHLHSLGFKTYNTLWDESYDNEPDFEKRLSMIVKLVDQLQNFNWQQHSKELEYIALYNQSNFMNQSNTIDLTYSNLENIVKKL